MRLPDNSQRISIVGRTGSGKTVGGVWHLSHADFVHNPWLVYDFKRDNLLADIGELKGTEHIDTSYLPKKPGIYFVHPHPDDTEQVQAQMLRIWEQENTGVFVDEGYMVCKSSNSNSAFRLLLTQGRSKRIPMIILSQRPVWMDRFVFSESDFYQIFALNHKGDRQKIMEYVPADLNATLPRYHSYYHDVSENETVILKPVPTAEDILTVFDSKLSTMRKRTIRVAI